MGIRCQNFNWLLRHYFAASSDNALLSALLTSVLPDGARLQPDVYHIAWDQATSQHTGTIGMAAMREGSDKAMLVSLRAWTGLFDCRELIHDANELVEAVGFEPFDQVVCIDALYYPLGTKHNFQYNFVPEYRSASGSQGLTLTAAERKALHCSDIVGWMPRYLLLVIPFAPEEPRTWAEQWGYYMRTGLVEEAFDAPGMELLRTQLREEQLAEADRETYQAYQQCLEARQQAYKLQGVAGLQHDPSGQPRHPSAKEILDILVS